MKKYIYSLSFLLLGSCGLLDIDPDHVVSTDKAFSDVESYEMALNNVYRNLASSTMTMQSSDYAAGDFVNVVAGYAPTNFAIYYWDYISQPQSPIWNYQYTLIANQNVVISNYDIVPTFSVEEERLKDQIYAQALGMRAWCLFNIAVLYAPHYDGTNGEELGIPLKLKLELEYLPRAPLSEVFAQIFSDLDTAEQMLVESGYSPNTSMQPYEFGIAAIRALRARVALYMGNSAVALEAASSFVEIELLATEDYDMLWSDGMGAALREIVFMSHDLSDTSDGEFIDYHEVFNGNNAALSDDFMALFTNGDVRNNIEYITSNRISSKYLLEAVSGTSSTRQLHYKHFRVAEQYLIYAECLVDSNPTKAMEVLNKLREYRGAELLTTPPSLQTIFDERRCELFGEGLSFYDLKRLSNELNITIQRQDGSVLTPKSNLYTWDIPISETNANPNI